MISSHVLGESGFWFSYTPKLAFGQCFKCPHESNNNCIFFILFWNSIFSNCWQYISPVATLAHHRHIGSIGTFISLVATSDFIIQPVATCREGGFSFSAPCRLTFVAKAGGSFLVRARLWIFLQFLQHFYEHWFFHLLLHRNLEFSQYLLFQNFAGFATWYCSFVREQSQRVLAKHPISNVLAEQRFTAAFLIRW